jgi:hypothetical protein
LPCDAREPRTPLQQLALYTLVNTVLFFTSPSVSDFGARYNFLIFALTTIALFLGCSPAGQYATEEMAIFGHG